jgi:predicted GIY-YIG superfamily endonuclease
MAIIITILSILLLGTLVYAFHEHQQARERIEFNNEIKERNAELERQLIELSNQEQSIKQTMERDLQSLKTIREATSNAFDAQEQMSQKAFENYCEVLDAKYQEKAEEFDSMSLQLDAAYDALQDRLLAEIRTQESELEKIKATRAALIKAQIKEKEIQENIDFYCLTLPVNDKDDIQRLEKVKKDLHNPRILSMLIWQTFFQKNMTTLCNNVLGTKSVTGIYKITNLNTNMCYIGQAVDVANRWKEHAKCGLGIDTPAGNKLYAAMMEDGIWNFSWELLESCERVLLDEKEKYYISVYQASEFGYNSNKGNSKKG